MTFSPGILSPQPLTMKGGDGVTYPDSYETEKVFFLQNIFTISIIVFNNMNSIDKSQRQVINSALILLFIEKLFVRVPFALVTPFLGIHSSSSI